MHSKFPWTTHPHTPTAVFDGDGRRIIDQWVAPDGWFPIETAPKDRFIIVYCPEDGSRWLAKWQGGEWYGGDCEHGILRAGKSLGDRSIVTGWFVSHWRDVPAPPSSPPAPTPLDPETAAANAVMIAGLPGLIEALEIARKHLSDIRSYACNHENRTCGDYDAECSISMGEWFSHDDLAELDKVDAALASIGRTP